MNLLRSLVCMLAGHEPVVLRRGNDSVLACERCGRHFQVFVANLYREQEQHPTGRGNSFGAK